MHPGNRAWVDPNNPNDRPDTTGCILPGTNANLEKEEISGSRAKLTEITNYILSVMALDLIGSASPSHYFEPTTIKINITDLETVLNMIFIEMSSIIF